MEKNEQLKELIQRTIVDENWTSRPKLLVHRLTAEIAKESSSVLDIGRSSRENFTLFANDQVKTADINQFDGYPDILLDVCDASTFPDNKFDAIICHSILEHVYEPQQAVKNMYNQLNPGGRFLGFAPFLMNYHAPKDLKFQDFYRFTRDGMAYLFREFDSVTLYPVRSRASSLASLIHPTKRYENKHGVEYVSRLLDRIFRGSSLQTTGYVVHARKKPQVGGSNE